MKLTVLITTYLMILMNTMNALEHEPVSYNTVRIENLNIFYREAGPKDAPVILLLHGVPTSSRMYQAMLESSLNTKYRLIAPDFPGFGHSSWPSPKEFNYTFDHLAEITEKFAAAMNLRCYILFLHDYGGPVGMRMAISHPEKVKAIIIQNAVSHEEGLSPLWVARRAFWQDRAANEAAFRKSFLSLDTTRSRHLGNSPHPEHIDPDTWTDEFYFLNQPEQADIQTDLFFDYQNNLKAYPIWQKWLRDHHPPLLVLWGRYDPSFIVAGAEAYRKDVKEAEIHILDAGHFALDEQAAEVISLTEAFLQKLSDRIQFCSKSR
ncbi:alpha/beta fold hydrolase [Criblamydia sequanensis]|uniref:Alpha/beta hydrolase domain-containing protein n=1 Tax=Candidatus Criblamydia sequanensis CRIB-18 TaxID=1437425 RepID=A0A090DYH1_9BACT|nr:alpha/beta hydrolase [Criblamydia sequanensis]CDR33749.1 Alpha/beta hydrolase domain-containing protein [Criblamydia sequanensis CRIB-18]